MWVNMRAKRGRPLYIAKCYFIRDTSHYASPKGQSPYTLLDDDIWEFCRDGDIILLGDFNVRIAQHRTSFFEMSETRLNKLDTTKLGLGRSSLDKECTELRIWLIPFEDGKIHGLTILNNLGRYPLSCNFTCFPHRHKASTVD